MSYPISKDTDYGQTKSRIWRTGHLGRETERPQAWLGAGRDCVPQCVDVVREGPSAKHNGVDTQRKEKENLGMLGRKAFQAKD